MNFKIACNTVVLLMTWVSGYAQVTIADSLKRQLAIHTSDDSSRVNLLNDLAFERYFDHPTEAANYAVQAGAIADRINFPSGLAQSYRMLGLTFWAQANLSGALDYFVKGLKLADSLNNQQLQADVNGNIGLVYIGMGNSTMALKYFSTSVTEQRRLKNTLREAAMLNNIGDCYLTMKKYDSAILVYQKALELGKPKKFGIATNTRNIGNVYEALGDFDQALVYYDKAKTISDSLSDRRGMTLVRKSIASVLFLRKQYEPAERLAQECLDIALKSRLKAVVRDSYQLLSKIAKSEGLTDKSLEYFDLFTLYRDSIQNLTESAKIASIQLEYETHRKQVEINSLKAQSQLKTALLVVAGVALLIIVILLLNTIRHYRKIKTRNDEILALNEEIRAQQEEVVLQRDSLVDKNIKIESLHRELSKVNEALETRVATHYAALKDQNKHFEHYAFVVSHHLRAPLARVLGIINLLEKDLTEAEQRQLMQHLKVASEDLDTVVRSINQALQQGMDTYDDINGDP
jgi:tetratricopeptide (TPR) repeat protein